MENDECKYIPGLQWREKETKDVAHETSSSVVTSASSLEEVGTEKRPIFHQVGGVPVADKQCLDTQINFLIS